MATQRKATSKASTKPSTKAGTAKKEPSRGTGGRVVEEIDKTMVAVYPAAKSGDFEALAKELIEAAEYPGQVETRSMPKRFVVPTKIAKAIGLA